jgi:hypothetical protein
MGVANRRVEVASVKCLNRSTNHLHVLLRHRLPLRLGRPFGRCAGLVDVEIELHPSDLAALHPLEHQLHQVGGRGLLRHRPAQYPAASPATSKRCPLASRGGSVRPERAPRSIGKPTWLRLGSPIDFASYWVYFEEWRQLVVPDADGNPLVRLPAEG